MHDIGGLFMMDFIFWGSAILVALALFFFVIAPLIFSSAKVVSMYAGLPLLALALIVVGYKVGGPVGWVIVIAGVGVGIYSYIYFKEKLYEE
ncbi:hypothetical protein KQI52_04070 [bacterium]|nr:hypothetical protein [bacterium]